jgi:hypothetical protein
MLVYGTLSGEPISLNPRDLMVGQKTVAGFWLSEWVRGQGVLTMLKLFRRVQRLLRAGVLTSERQSFRSLSGPEQPHPFPPAPGEWIPPARGLGR